MTEAIFQEFLVEVSGHSQLGDGWVRQGEFLKGNVASAGAPQPGAILLINQLLMFAERRVRRRQDEVSETLEVYQQTLAESTGLPLED